MQTNYDGMSTIDYGTAASNTSIALTYTAQTNYYHQISGIAWSFKGGTPDSALTIKDGSNTVFSVDITVAGAYFIPFDPPKRGSLNTALTVTLAAAGSGVTGKLNALGHRLVSRI